MPIYEYSCDICGKEFEELVHGNADPGCPECGSDKTTRLVSCACVRTSSSGDYGPSSSHGGYGSGCCGCSGGNCASCH